MSLERAVLTYGSRSIPVVPSELNPLPAEFDFQNPVECARLIFAIMSAASGGHSLHDCKVRVDQERRTANLTCSGAHVFYAEPGRQKLTVEEALEIMRNRAEPIQLGSVVSRWNRPDLARWF